MKPYILRKLHSRGVFIWLFHFYDKYSSCYFFFQPWPPFSLSNSIITISHYNTTLYMCNPSENWGSKSWSEKNYMGRKKIAHKSSRCKNYPHTKCKYELLSYVEREAAPHRYTFRGKWHSQVSYKRMQKCIDKAIPFCWCANHGNDAFFCFFYKERSNSQL